MRDNQLSNKNLGDKILMEFLGLISPIEPFSTINRFITAAIFGIFALEILKHFEELLFNIGKSTNSGILIELLERIGLIVLIG
jgi:hypothetical protein